MQVKKVEKDMDEVAEQVRAAFAELGTPYEEWFLDQGAIDLRAAPPEGVFDEFSGEEFFAEARRLGLRTVTEGFADRAYLADATLVPRGQPGAVLHDATEIADRVEQMVTTGTITAVDGTRIELNVESICVHGDSPGATQIARAVRTRLQERGVTLEAFS